MPIVTPTPTAMAILLLLFPLEPLEAGSGVEPEDGEDDEGDVVALGEVAEGVEEDGVVEAGDDPDPAVLVGAKVMESANVPVLVTGSFTPSPLSQHVELLPPQHQVPPSHNVNSGLAISEIYLVCTLCDRSCKSIPIHSLTHSGACQV
jgi:hypothetical protein